VTNRTRRRPIGGFGLLGAPGRLGWDFGAGRNAPGAIGGITRTSAEPAIPVLLLLINDLAADDRVQDLGPGDLIYWNREQILRQHHEVRQFPR
jgi:hypothetical protein